MTVKNEVGCLTRFLTKKSESFVKRIYLFYEIEGAIAIRRNYTNLKLKCWEGGKNTAKLDKEREI